MISHSVFFKLKHDADSTKETLFIERANTLRHIPGVVDFKIVREISPQNPFDFGLTMTFPDQASYDRYNAHPVHVHFVEECWTQEVSDFQEIDYTALPN